MTPQKMGRKGGKSRSLKKIQAVKANLIRANEERMKRAKKKIKKLYKDKAPYTKEEMEKPPVGWTSPNFLK